MERESNASETVLLNWSGIELTVDMLSVGELSWEGKLVDPPISIWKNGNIVNDDISWEVAIECPCAIGSLEWSHELMKCRGDTAQHALDALLSALTELSAWASRTANTVPIADAY